jgi:hypothetical protein
MSLERNEWRALLHCTGDESRRPLWKWKLSWVVVKNCLTGTHSANRAFMPVILQLVKDFTIVEVDKQHRCFKRIWVFS